MKQQLIDIIPQCYSVNAVEIGGQPWLLFAGEGDGSLYAYHGNDFAEKTVIMSQDEKLGGVMSISVVPDQEGYFFFSTGFFTMIRSETSSIYLACYQNGGFQRVKVCDIPYLHRFDVIASEGRRFLIACTLHEGKKDLADWSTPGKIYVAEVPFNLDGDVAIQPEILAEGFYQNHGFNRVPGTNQILTASREGIFRVTPPVGDGDWSVERIFDFPASDVCAYDLDGDGELEYGVISPFHGNRFQVYRKTAAGAELLYEHQKPLDFYHAIFSDTWNGTPVFVIGARKMDMDLYKVFWNPEAGILESQIIESGAGSSNARIIHTSRGDILMSADRQKPEAEAVIFTD